MESIENLIGNNKTSFYIQIEQVEKSNFWGMNFQFVVLLALSLIKAGIGAYQHNKHKQLQTYTRQQLELKQHNQEKNIELLLQQNKGKIKQKLQKIGSILITEINKTKESRDGSGNPGDNFKDFDYQIIRQSQSQINEKNNFKTQIELANGRGIIPQQRSNSTDENNLNSTPIKILTDGFKSPKFIYQQQEPNEQLDLELPDTPKINQL